MNKDKRKYIFIIVLISMLSDINAQLITPDVINKDTIKKISIASEPDYPPYCIVDKNGNADGFSVDLFKAAAKAVGIEVDIKIGIWNQIKQDLAEGKIDALPLVGRTPEREPLYDFTLSYLTLHGTIFIREGTAGIKTVDDLKDKAIIVMKGDNAEEFVRRRNISKNIITTNTFEEAFRLLADGEYDAVITQEVMGLRLLQELKIESVVPLDIPLDGFRQDFCFAVKKGNKYLLSRLNEGLSIVIANRTYDAIHLKWFGPSVQKHIALKDVIRIALYIFIPLIILFSIVSILFLRSEVKKRTYKLQESEEQSRAIIAQLPSIVMIHKDDKIVFLNQVGIKLIGYSLDEICSRSIFDFLDDESKPIVARNTQSRVSGEIVEDYEVGVITKTNHKKTLIIRAIPINYENGPALLVVLTDITERKRAENAVAESNHQRRLILECAGEGIFGLDKNGNHTFVNPMAAKLLGYEEAELNDRCSHTTFHHTRPNGSPFPREECPIYETLRDGKIHYGEEYFWRKDGSAFWVEFNSTPIYENEKIVGAVVIFNDITEHKRKEEELIIAKEKAERSDKLKDAFIANISHEIRTPLNIILGYTGIIEETFASQASKEEQIFFTSVQSGADRLMRTVDLVLSISRVQAGDVTLKLETIQFPEFIEKLINELTPQAQKKSLALSFLNDFGHLAVNADTYCLSQALINLIDNAIKYTKKGSITVRLHQKQKDVYLDIIDTGIGISEAYITDVFKPYSQEEIGYTRGYEGIGLGLTLVKQYLSLHHVPITITSKKGFGSTFSVCLTNIILPNYLPDRTEKISWEELQSHQVKAMNVTPTMQKLVILSVEDDQMTQVYMKEILQKKFEVVFTDSVAGAWKIIRSRPVDLILLDISLQGDKNGLDLIRELRVSEKYSTLPVIAVTAHAFAKDRINSMDAGCDAYIAKPMSKTKLFQMIDEVMENSSTRLSLRDFASSL